MAVIPDVDQIINQLQSMRSSPSGEEATEASFFEEDIRYLISKTKTAFLNQPMLLDLHAPIKVVGNLLGQFKDLLEVFQVGGKPPQTNYLFLGDYVDRGYLSIETICLLMSYKVKYPNNVFLLRGHHECARVNQIYGFYDECKRRFSEELWMGFVDCFNCMPVAALVDRKVFCCHGGLSPQLSSLEQIRMIPRPCDVPTEGLLCDLLYADPSEDVEGWSKNPQGMSFSFGKDVVDDFLKRFNLKLIARSHQVAECGYELFAGERKLVTIFSAVNFCEMGNYGAIMNVELNSLCTFDFLRPRKFNIPKLPSEPLHLYLN